VTNASRFAKAAKRSTRQATRTIVENLEARAYLTGVVLGTPQNLNAPAAAIAPVFVNLDDINGDGKADLVAASDASGAVPNSVGIIPGKGDGTFGATTSVALDFSPITLADAILTANGKFDVVAGSASTPTVGVILQATDGSFPAAATDYAATGLANTHAVAVADFNGDGKLDIAVVSDDNNQSDAVPNFAVLLNNGSGGFTLGQTLSITHVNLSAITAFTSGGHTDLAVTNQTSNSVTILVGSGTGTFTQTDSYPVGSSPVSIVTADFNNDGKADLAIANSTSANISVLLGLATDTFQAAVNTTIPDAPATGGPLKIRVSNLNNDGKSDLLALLGPGSGADADLMLGNADGTFHFGTSVITNGNQRIAIAAGDLDADGLTDLEIADPLQATSLINVTNQDHTAPTAAVDITQPVPVAAATTIDFTVTFSDNTQVDATTLGDHNVTVTDPNGVSHNASLVGTSYPNGPTVTVTYRMAAPSGSLSTADNGAYTVIATSNNGHAVKDANANALAGGTIGTFTVFIPPSAVTGPNLVAGPVSAKLPTSVVGGAKGSGAKVTITNKGTTAATGTIAIQLFASQSNTAVLGDSTLLTTVNKKINLGVNKKVTVSFPAFKWPTGVSGKFFLVANVNSTNVIVETNYADNIGASTKAVTVAPPFIDPQNIWNGKFKTPKAGTKEHLTIQLKNNGNVAAKGAATVVVYASPDANILDGTQLASAPVKVSIPPGKKTTTSATFMMPTLAAGTYHLITVVTVANDTIAGNNTSASVGTFTV
jgi:hypothetical protein